MKKYRVEFFYYTDQRWDWEGDAVDDRMALTLALASQQLTEWVMDVGFHVEIHMI